MARAEEFITLARVAKTQGRRGEVAADLHSDFPELFAERRRLFALLADGTRRELDLESFWPHKARLILKFAGVDTISDAEALIGAEIQIPARERAKLEPGVQYISDLVGCSVSAKAPEFTEAQELGTIEHVQFGAGEAPLLVIRKGNEEHLVPFAAEYISAIDVSGKRIELVLPEGMLEINSPLTADEKQERPRGKRGERN